MRGRASPKTARCSGPAPRSVRASTSSQSEQQADGFFMEVTIDGPAGAHARDRQATRTRAKQGNDLCS